MSLDPEALLCSLLVMLAWPSHPCDWGFSLQFRTIEIYSRV